MAARRTLAAGSARAAKPTLGSGRPDYPVAALEMGAVRRDLSRRQGIAERQSALVAAAADGPDGTAVPGLSEFCGLYVVEELADLFDHRRLSRHPHRRQPADATPKRAARATALRRASRTATTSGARRL